MVKFLSKSSAFTGWVTLLVALACGLQCWLSLPLWTGAGRWFPLVPMGGPAHFPWQGLPDFQMVEGVLAFAATALLLVPRRAARVAWLVVMAFLVGRDVNRLQVWLYFYALVVVALLLDEGRARQSVRWLLVAVYVWGGFNKLTPYFAEDNWTFLVDGFPALRRLADSPVIGYGVAAFELILGLLLAWPRTRRAARWLVLAFHGFIIAALSPWGLHWNTVVIPWNAAMAALVWLSFTDREPLARPDSAPAWALWVLAAVMPALQLAHAWPYPLSWTMYDNTQSEGTFVAEGPPPAADATWRIAWEAFAAPNNGRLYLGEWGQENLHVPINPEPGALRKVGDLLCRYSMPSDSNGLYLLTIKRWNREHERFEKIPCSEL